MGTTLLGVITLSGANTTNCLEPHLPRYTKYGWAPVAKMPFEKISPPRDWPENEPKYPRFSLVRVPNSYPRNQILELVTCKTQEAFDQATTAAVQRMYPRLKQPSNDPSLVVKSKTQTSQEGKPGSTPRQSSAQPVPQPSPPMEGQKLGSGTLHARRNSLSSRDNRATTQAAQSSHPGQAQGATGRRGVLAAARDKGRKVSSVMGWTR
jgi:hypothetical protein